MITKVEHDISVVKQATKDDYAGVILIISDICGYMIDF